MNERGHYGNAAVGRSTLGPRGRHLYGGPTYGTNVGIALFHSQGDEVRLSNEINASFEALVDAMYRAMGVPRRSYTDAMSALAKNPAGFSKQLTNELATMHQSPFYTVWASKIAPVYEEWKALRHDPGGGGITGALSAIRSSFLYGPITTSLFGGDFDVYKRWFGRLSQAFAAAQAANVPNLPDPPKAPDKTVLEEAADIPGKLAKKVGEGAKEVFDFTKVVVYGGLAIVGALAITLVVQSTRGKDTSQITSLVRRPK
jgi:hypothetical protein